LKPLNSNLDILKNAIEPSWLKTVAHDSLLGMKDLMAIFGLNKSCLELFILNGQFPCADYKLIKGQQLGRFFKKTSRGWKASTVRSFINDNRVTN
jgi:predicted DNA-binding transcriptional regulator AlpA